MASIVKECYSWGVVGCGWLGQAFARHRMERGEAVWGSGRTPKTLEDIKASGAHPLAVDFAEKNPTSHWPSCQHLLVALPPSALMHNSARSAIKTAMEKAQWTVLISSTSVYPEPNGRYVEDDAIHRISPHSGVSVKAMEETFSNSKTSILRAGGLIGPGRALFRNKQRNPMVDPTRILNVVHQEDVIAAIVHLAKARRQGPYNLTCPISRSRQDILASSSTIQPQAPAQSRVISAQKILDSGFAFLYPDPMSMPDLFPIKP